MNAVRRALWGTAHTAGRLASAVGAGGLYDLPGGRALLVPSLPGGRLGSVSLTTPRVRVRYLSSPPGRLAPLPALDDAYTDAELPAPATEALDLRDARVIGRNGAIVEPASGRVVFESVCSRRSQLDKLRELSGVRLLDRPRSFHGPLSVLASFGAGANYFQFVTDVVARLYALRGDGGDLASLRRSAAGVTFVLDAAAPPWARELVDLLGLDVHLEPLTSRSDLRVEHLVFLPCPTWKEERSDVTLFLPTAVRWLRAVLLEAAGAAPPGSRRRLYLSRRGAPWRRLRNEDELVERLEGAGFEAVACELLSVSEQIRLFAAAEAVVAPHGSALTNILFASDCTVIEIVSPAYPSAVVYALANALGHPYWYVPGRDASGSGLYDFACDPELLARTLGAALTR